MGTRGSVGRRRKALGWFLEFRMIPVLLWSYSAVALGSAVAFAEHGSLDLVWFAAALALGALIQGWVTHAINEIYDWRSGTDRIEGGRALSGGSRVINLRILSERDLWIMFAASSVAVAALALWIGIVRAPWLVLIVATGYALGLAYTLPPIATSYRPFTGEWLGGFPGVLLAGLGAYAIQALVVSWTAILALTAHALVCCGMLVVHHYLDAPMDASARPQKRTVVLALGSLGARSYATALALAAAVLYAFLAVASHPVFATGAAATAVAVWVHRSVDPTDLKSVTRNELRIIQLGIAATLGTAVGLAPGLWPLFPLAAAGYFAHLVAVSPARDLARAWRRPRPSDADDPGR